MKISDSAVSLIKQAKLIQEKGKVTDAKYAYQADCDGDWEDIRVDFVEGKGTVLCITELDTLKSQIYGQRVISYILNCKPEELPKDQYIPLDWQRKSPRRDGSLIYLLRPR